MTTYNASAVTNTAIAFQKPITLQQGRALRDNPLAVQEADATAPLSLLPTVFLGSIAISAGSNTISGLVLAPYRMLRLVFVAASSSGGVSNWNLNGVAFLASVASGAVLNGMLDIDLQNGVGMFAMTAVGGANFSGGRDFDITTANTAFTILITGAAAYSGAVRVYGLK